MTEEEEIRSKLGDQRWRINNLYWIIDKKGQRVKLRMNWAQEHLYDNMWYLMLVLKVRQLGITTFWQIYMLDQTLFNNNISAGVIAHNREDAQDFFKKKIKYAYDNLPGWLKADIPTTGDSQTRLEFEHGSSIRVGTSLRSGTYQLLHVSEYGKICAKFPEKAEEVKTGALNTIQAGCLALIESTAEGAHGDFYDLCQDARRKDPKGLTLLDWKFFFFDWMHHPEYVLEGDVPISANDEKYFAKVEKENDLVLTTEQKNWYIKKKETQRSKMKQEFPSDPDEAFEIIVEHAVYAEEMQAVIEEDRILELPWNPDYPVYTFWDLGRSKTDAMTFWFGQYINGWYHWIDYYEKHKKKTGHYAKIIKEKEYSYDGHYIPHDGEQDDFDLDDFKSKMERHKIGRMEVVKRIGSLSDGIDSTRTLLAMSKFDKNKCAPGIRALMNYSYKWDDDKRDYTDIVHNWASHPCDAIRQCAQGFKPNYGWAGHMKKEKKSTGYTRRQRDSHKPTSMVV